ncbi:hypothetical protein FisN_7Lu222 [Fistulifera solaris]|uniref:Uncharacterized protein n=1 Tax=Fistulifera solaris TaxID=1519565 RepID=A0A1Z5JDF8_FISSO|nr:hypothetical protein FisN_7Lu222 [Fistulifera solaris]|eukprot:GAX11808.1 hypothetical protein FisN_7Lu222 [Fistulifera solaris]
MLLWKQTRAFVSYRRTRKPPAAMYAPDLVHNPIAYFKVQTAYNGRKDSVDETTETNMSIWESMKERPATLMALPIVFLVSLDLLLNITFLVKRTIEYAVFGKIPSTETWF